MPEENIACPCLPLLLFHPYCGNFNFYFPNTSKKRGTTPCDTRFGLRCKPYQSRPKNFRPRGLVMAWWWVKGDKSNFIRENRESRWYITWIISPFRWTSQWIHVIYQLYFEVIVGHPRIGLPGCFYRSNKTGATRTRSDSQTSGEPSIEIKWGVCDAYHYIYT